nr:recombinase family protein [[Clostridium] scindens]
MKLSVINTKVELQQRKLRVCAYVRVSSDKDAQMESLENQEAYFKRKYAQDDTCDFLGVFSDAGISGTSDNRPAFQKMLECCRNGEIDLIHTKSISRFARKRLRYLKYQEN